MAPAAPSRSDPLSDSKTRSWGSIFQRGGKLVDRLAVSVKDAARSPLLKQAVDAHERGNLPAAFWLLDEEFKQQPENVEVCVAFWDIAVQYAHQSEAMPAASRLVDHHANAGNLELASQYWLELITTDPLASASPSALIRVLTLLRQQQEAEDDPKKQPERMAALLRALRVVLDDESGGLTTGVAMRVAELAREVDPPTALEAARHCLEAESLHEVKRARMIDLILELDPDADLERPPPPPDPAPLVIAKPPIASAPRRGPQRKPEGHSASLNHPLATESPAYEGLTEEEISQIELPPTSSPRIASPERSDEPPPEVAATPKLRIRCLEGDLRSLDAEKIVLEVDEGRQATIRFGDVRAVTLVEIALSPERSARVVDLLLNRPGNPDDELRVVRITSQVGDAIPLKDVATMALAAGPALALPERDMLLEDAPPEFASHAAYQTQLARWLEAVEAGTD